MNDITFDILKIVVSVVSALVAAYLIPYIKNKTADAKYAALVAMVDTAVKAAEQTIGAGHGKDKKAEVVEFVTGWLNENGVKIDTAQLDYLVECAVWTMKTAQEG